jgi:thiol:disulfide interchange protein
MQSYYYDATDDNRPESWLSQNKWMLVIGLIFAGVLVFQIPSVKRAFGGGVGADGIGWKDSFSEASSIANQTGRPILIKFTADWCPPCRQMKQNVWPNEQVRQAVETRYVPLVADVDTSEGARLAQQYGVQGIPTIIITDSSGRVQRTGSFMDSNRLLSFLIGD